MRRATTRSGFLRFSVVVALAVAALLSIDSDNPRATDVVLSGDHGARTAGAGIGVAWAQGAGEPDETVDPAVDEAVEVTFVYPITSPITSSVARSLRKNLDTILADPSVRGLIIELNTPGGEVEATRSIVEYLQRVAEKGVTTVAYVPTGGMAISGGTLVAFACQHLTMGDRTKIGNVAPVMGMQELSEKYQSGIRADIRRLAEARGYPVELAEAMVSKRRIVYEVTFREGGQTVRRYLRAEAIDKLSDRERNDIVQRELVVGENETLTITESEALRFGFTENIVDSRFTVVQRYNLPLTIRDLQTARSRGELPSSVSGVLDFFNYSFVKFLLIIAGILGFVIELKVPGLGLPGLVGLGAFSLFFVAGYYDVPQTVNWIEAGLFVLSLLFLAIEVFVVPGFGVAGVLGLGLLFASLVLSLQPVTAPFSTDQLLDNMLVVMSGLGCSVVGIFVVLRYLPSSSMFARSGIISNTTLEGATSPKDDSPSSGSADWVGHLGTAMNALRPAGKMELADGRVLDVVTEGEFVERGAPVEVLKVEGNRVVVRLSATRPPQLEGDGVESKPPAADAPNASAAEEGLA